MFPVKRSRIFLTIEIEVTKAPGFESSSLFNGQLKSHYRGTCKLSDPGMDFRARLPRLEAQLSNARRGDLGKSLTFLRTQFSTNNTEIMIESI